MSNVPGNILSLPFDILNKIGLAIVSQDPDPPFLRRIEPYRRSGSVAKFVASRRTHQTQSPYRVRLVCWSLNTILVPHLFRNAHIRLSWDGLRINPPLSKLSTVWGGAQVFQRNVKSLRLSSLFRRMFDDDNESEYRAAAAHGLYSGLMRTGLQKLAVHLLLLADLENQLSDTIKSMEHLQELRCEISEMTCPFWYLDILLKVLSAAKKIQFLHLERPYASGMEYPDKYPAFHKLVPTICGMHNLKAFELSSLDGPQQWLDELWKTLAKSRDVTLKSITTDSITMPQLEYLASYSGLKTLACAAIHIGIPIRHLDDQLKTFMRDSVIPCHQDTLLDLRMPFIEGWFIDSTDIGALARCKKLRSLTTNLLVGVGDVALVDFVTLMGQLKSISSLIHLTLNLIDGVDHTTYTGHQHPVFGIMDEVIRGYQPEPTTGPGLCPSITVCGHSNDGVVILRYTLGHRLDEEGEGTGMHYRYHLAVGEIPEYFPPKVDDGERQSFTELDDNAEDDDDSDDSDEEAYDSVRGTGKMWAEKARENAYGPGFQSEWDRPEM